jgi:HSP20 family protein
MNLIRRPEGREPALLSRLDPLRSFRDLLSWDPFAEMEPLLGSSNFSVMPNVEVKETKDSLVFKADLPGIKEKDVEISLTGNRLSISGKREQEEEKKDGDRYYAYERWYGSFNRTFTLPETVDADGVKADLRDGVLTISVPKKAGAQPRAITIGTGGSSEGKGEERAESQKVTKAA